jgi:hypothetical protein
MPHRPCCSELCHTHTNKRTPRLCCSQLGHIHILQLHWHRSCGNIGSQRTQLHRSCTQVRAAKPTLQVHHLFNVR